MASIALARPSVAPLHRALAWSVASATPWRRKLTMALGGLWLLDAGLQFQPFMFTRTFPEELIKPVGIGSPAWVSGATHWAGSLMAGHIVVWNALFATTQLLIGAGLCFRRTSKPALLASFGWALMVWWLGEGLGGVLSGPISPVMGLPGAVILYAFAAVLLWPPSAATQPGRSAVAASPLRWGGAAALWLLLWGVFAFEALRPANRSPSTLHDMVTMMESGQPSWIKAVGRVGAGALAHHGNEASLLLAACFAVIGVCVFLPSLTRAGLVLAMVVATLIWVFGESFGGLATGTATDPNSGPLLILLALCFWPVSGRRRMPLVGRAAERVRSPNQA